MGLQRTFFSVAAYLITRKCNGLHPQCSLVITQGFCGSAHRQGMVGTVCLCAIVWGLNRNDLRHPHSLFMLAVGPMALPVACASSHVVAGVQGQVLSGRK